MVRARLPLERDEFQRKGSKDVVRQDKKRRGGAGGTPVGFDDGDDDDEDGLGGHEDDEEGLEGLGVPLGSVVKVSWAKSCPTFQFRNSTTG